MLRVHLFLAVALTASNIAAGEPASKVRETPLTTLAQILSLTNSDAGNHYPVKLRAQVTLYTKQAWWLFLQDGQAGVYSIRPDDNINVRSGDWIDVEGATESGGFAPNLQIHKLRVIGHGPLPAPVQPRDPNHLLPESANLWALARGRILNGQEKAEVGYVALNFDLKLEVGGRIPVEIGDPGNCNRGNFVDADVVIHGVLGTAPAGAGNRKWDVLFVHTCDDIEVTKPPREDWTIPEMDIGRLLTYGSGTQDYGMVRVRGIVTLARTPDQIFIQNGLNGILVEPIMPATTLRNGQCLEVLGRITQDEEGIRRLVAGRLRASSVRTPIGIRHLTVDDIDQPAFAEALVTARSKVLSRELTPKHALFGLKLGAKPLSAELPLAPGQTTDDLPEVGDLASFTGVGLVHLDDRDYNVMIEARSSHDIVITAKRPLAESIPWGRVAVAAIGLALGFLFWVSALGSRVQARTQQLEDANKRAEQARADAEQASRIKGEFLANMSHEIRTPMNGILGMTDSVLETSLTCDQRELIETAKNSAEGLLIIIDDILDFSKIEAGKLTLDLTAFPLRTTVAQVLNTHRLSAVKKGLALLCDIQADVPDRIVSDPTRLRQIITNLVGNAIKFTAAGVIELRVKLGERSADNATELHFWVSDTGIGIPADKHRSIFESFSQADTSTTRKFGGTGLGLTICSKLVEMLGGKLWVESEIGKGSCFHFTLQAGLAPGECGIDPKLSRDDAAVQSTIPPLKILLADDNLVNQRVAARLLEKEGHLVALAGTGKIALDLLARQPFDMILMDVQMPEMDGLEATAAIRRNEAGTGRHIPIVALTAHAMSGDRERCLGVGMDGYATKPICVEDLKAEIHRVWLTHDDENAPVTTYNL